MSTTHTISGGPTTDTRAIHVDPATLPLERLEAQICDWAAHLAAGEALWLDLVAEFDRRKGFAQWGLVSTAHWLAWKCALSPNAARERVRVARALQDLPNTRALFGQGKLSYSKVRAITRVAEPDTEDDLLALARNATASQLERITQAWRRSENRPDANEAQRRHQDRSLTWRTDDGMVVGTFRLPPEEAALVTKAIDVHTAPPPARAQRDVASDVSAETPTIAQRRADALVELASAGVVGTPRRGDERVMAVIEVSADVLTSDGDGACHVENGPAIAAETALRLTCDSTTVVVAVDADGNEVAESQPTRSIPRSTRRALRRRDKGHCQFPGCGSTLGVEAHHIKHRARGGSHALSNLVTLCKHHHHLVHEGGFSVEALAAGRVHIFRRPDGKAIALASPDRRGSPTELWQSMSHPVDGDPVGPSTIWSGTGERLDLDFTMWALAGNIANRRRRAQEDQVVNPTRS